MGIAVIDYIQKHDLAGHAEKMGMRFRAGLDALLKDYPALLLEVRQSGLMIGLQYTNESIGPRMTKNSPTGASSPYTRGTTRAFAG